MKAIINFYRSFEDESDRAIIKVVAGLGLITFVVTIYIAVALIF